MISAVKSPKTNSYDGDTLLAALPTSGISRIFFARDADKHDQLQEARSKLGSEMKVSARLSDTMELGIDSRNLPRMTLTLPDEILCTIAKSGILHTGNLNNNLAFARAIGPFVPDVSLKTFRQKACLAARKLIDTCEPGQEPTAEYAYFDSALQQLIPSLRNAGDSPLGSNIPIVVRDNAGRTVFVSLACEADKLKSLRGNAIRTINAFTQNALLEGKNHKLAERIANAQKYIEEIEDYFLRAQQGMKLEDIAAHFDVAPRTVSGRLNGVVCKELQAIDSSKQNGIKPTSFNLQNCSPEQWASYLGHFCALRPTGQLKKRIEFRDQDQKLIEELFETKCKLFPSGVRPVIRTVQAHGNTVHCCHVTSTALTAELNNCTKFGSHLPWKYLQSKPEQLHFLRAFLNVRGSISNHELSTRRHDNLPFAVELAVLMDEVGIGPTVQTDSTPRVCISNRAGLSKLLELDLITSDKKRTMIEGILDRPFKYSSYDEDTYDAVTAYRIRNSDASYAEISAVTGVPAKTLEDWFESGVLPPAVVRKQKLENLRDLYQVEEVRNALLNQ